MILPTKWIVAFAAVVSMALAGLTLISHHGGSAKAAACMTRSCEAQIRDTATVQGASGLAGTSSVAVAQSQAIKRHSKKAMQHVHVIHHTHKAVVHKAEVHHSVVHKTTVVHHKTHYPVSHSVTSLRIRAYDAAITREGGWYAWGGLGPTDFDCSGLIVWAYAQAGVTLPRTTYGMLASSQLVQVTHPETGDLAFFGTGHVEMYVKPGVTFGAHHSGTTIGFRSFSGYYQPTAYYAVR